MKKFLLCIILYFPGTLVISFAQNNRDVLKDDQLIRKLIALENTGKSAPGFTPNRILVTGLSSQPNVGVLSTEQISKDKALPVSKNRSLKRRTVLRLVVSDAGDIAYEFGSYNVDDKSRSSKENSSGSYLRTWKKVGNKWLIDVLFEKPR